MQSNLKLVRPITLLFLLIGLISFTLSTPLSIVRSAATHIVISEVQIGGGVSTDEFVELYNPTGATVDVTGWKLQKLTAAQALPGTDVLVLSGSIPAHGYLLLAHTDYDGSLVENQTYSLDDYSSNNTVILRDNTDTIIDHVGMGSAGTFEGTGTASVPANNGSIERKALGTSTSTSMTTGSDVLLGNGEDTDDNDADFVTRALSEPQNLASEVEPALLSSPSPTATATATASPTGTSTPTVTPTATPSPTMSATPTMSPTGTPTMEPTHSPKPTKTPRPMTGFSCRMEFKYMSFGFFSLKMPFFNCTFR